MWEAQHTKKTHGHGGHHRLWDPPPPQAQPLISAPPDQEIFPDLPDGASAEAAAPLMAHWADVDLMKGVSRRTAGVAARKAVPAPRTPARATPARRGKPRVRPGRRKNMKLYDRPRLRKDMLLVPVRNLGAPLYNAQGEPVVTTIVHPQVGVQSNNPPLFVQNKTLYYVWGHHTKDLIDPQSGQSYKNQYGPQSSGYVSADDLDLTQGDGPNLPGKSALYAKKEQRWEHKVRKDLRHAPGKGAVVKTWTVQPTGPIQGVYIRTHVQHGTVEDQTNDLHPFGVRGDGQVPLLFNTPNRKGGGAVRTLLKPGVDKFHELPVIHRRRPLVKVDINAQTITSTNDFSEWMFGYVELDSKSGQHQDKIYGWILYQVPGVANLM